MILKNSYRCESKLPIVGKKIAIEVLSCLSVDLLLHENRSISCQSIVRWDNSHRLHKETASLKRQGETEKRQNHSMYGKRNDTRRDFYGGKVQPFNYRKGHQGNKGWSLKMDDFFSLRKKISCDTTTTGIRYG